MSVKRRREHDEVDRRVKAEIKEKKAKKQEILAKVESLKPNIITLSEMLLHWEIDEDPLTETHANPYVDIIQKCNTFVHTLGLDIQNNRRFKTRLDLANELRETSGMFLALQEQQFKGVRPSSTSDFHVCCVARNNLKSMIEMYKQVLD
jgi:hypothetical protein